MKSGFYRTGAAAVAYFLGNEISHEKLGLGGHAEVFDAEMAALSKAASIATSERYSPSNSFATRER